MKIEPQNAEQLLQEVESVVAEIKPLLAGRYPGVQGAVLADLVAHWVVGHTPEARDEIVRSHIELVDKLIPIAEHAVFGPLGHPGRTSS